METNKSIPKPKQRLLRILLATFISLLAISFLQHPLTVHAEGDYAGWAASLCHSTGDTNTGGSDIIVNGVSKERTGYLCYLLTADGQQTGNPAIAFQSPGFSYIDSYVWYCTSRKNHTVSSFSGVAPWNTTPWGSCGSPTYESQIKAWFEGVNASNEENGTKFIYDNWGYDAAKKYTQGDYILVIETLMHFQYSTSSSSLSDADISSLAEALVTELYGPPGHHKLALETDARKWGVNLDAMNPAQASMLLDSIREYLLDALKKELASTIGGSGRTFVGDPVIGTPANLLDYKDKVNCPSNPFRSYTNKVAPFAERAIADGVAERAGFDVWSGGTSSEISYAEVQRYGLAMMIITATDPGQTTCDEPEQPSPHDPPEESEGTCTIIKSYREIQPDGTPKHISTHSLSGVSNNILIEDESEYKVVGWKTSTSANLNISSIGWETNVPNLIGEQGTTPTTVELPNNYKYLYVLLEKGEPEEEEELDVNYVLTQSTIARHITLNNPDAWTPTMEKLADITFKWALPAVSDTCNGHSWSHSGSLDGCTNQGTRSCNCGACTSSCTTHSGEGHSSTCDTSWCQLEHTHTSSCDQQHCTTDHNGTCRTSHNSGCTNGQKYCAGHTAYCTWGQWTDPTYQRLLKRNYTNNTSQRIIASNDNPNYNKLVSGANTTEYAPTSQTRTGIGYTYVPNSTGETNFDFHTIIHRGDTQLVLAEWKNTSTAYLEGISPSHNYTVSNTIPARTGVVKDSDYEASFTIKIGDASPNKDTTRAVTTPSGHGTCSPRTVNLGLISPGTNGQSITGTAKVFVYAAKPSLSNTAINTAPQSERLGNIHVSGVMVKSGSVTNFLPYVQMKYDTIYTDNQPNLAYVLGEVPRTLNLNSYAEIEWTKQTTPNLTLSSLQWSTHNEANKNHSPGTVLPGGATLTLSIRENHRQIVRVHTYQPVLEGAGKTQVDNTGGDSSLTNAAGALAAHNTFVADVRTNLDSLHLQQWFANADYATNPGGDRTTSKDVFDNGGIVDNGVDFNGFGGSDETKYYFDTDTSAGGINGASSLTHKGLKHHKVLFFCSFLNQH